MLAARDGAKSARRAFSVCVRTEEHGEQLAHGHARCPIVSQLRPIPLGLALSHSQGLSLRLRVRVEDAVELPARPVDCKLRKYFLV